MRARDEQTRILRNGMKQRDASLDFAQRVALFACSLDKSTAQALVAGLGGDQAERALSLVVVATAWDSSTRQGRLSHEFGVRLDHIERLKALMQVASPTLQAVMFKKLEPWQQSLFPRLKKMPTPVSSPAMTALAERLVREATR